VISERLLDIVKPIVGAFSAPLVLALVLVLLGALFLLLQRRILGRSLLVFALAFIFLASWHPMAERVLEPLEWSHAPLSDPAGLSGVSAVVVLGAGWRSEWQAPASIRLSENSALRLLEGLRLIEALPEARLVVSGASRNRDRLPVAVGYAEAAQALGVNPSRIVVLDTPVDTAQEAYAVREVLAEGERFLLVTSAAHMRRAVRHFERAGLDPIPAPTDFTTGTRPVYTLSYWLPSAQNLRKTERAIHEYLGLLALSLDHWGKE
jgi:uncharacterized SAM-binding protein YcdF (DUF218 family)